LKSTPFHPPPLNAHYEGAYDERTLAWRRLGAADKARNLLRLLAGERAEDVLEVGCGTGALLAELARARVGRRHVGVDVADPAAHRDPDAAALDLRVYDGHTLPFAARSFDLVLASHVIEHVPEPRRLLAEMARVAARWIYVEVPCELHLRTSHRALQQSLDIGHINAYTPESFQLLLETSGLEVARIALFDHSFAIHRFGGGWLRSAFKAAVRGATLALSPRLAGRLFTYHCGALVRC
jgi:SAM-dependent methyltransferase